VLDVNGFAGCSDVSQADLVSFKFGSAGRDETSHYELFRNHFSSEYKFPQKETLPGGR
jgi:hypothetical protein